MRACTKLSIVVTAIATCALNATAQDWPQWRGAARDGVVTAFNVPASWPDALKKQWSVEVGLGYTTPVLVSDRIYVFSRRNDDEILAALNADTGETVWQTNYPAPFDMTLAAARHRAGPKATPAFADGRLFTLGMTGAVTAFDATTGEQLWQVAGTGVETLFHTAMSPIVDGNIVIVHVGGHDDGALTAFDVATGDVRWSWDGDGPAYGSPMIFEFGGIRQVVVFTQEHFIGVSLETGTLLWSRPFTTPSTTTSQTPILYKDMVIENGRGNRITAFRVTNNGGNWITENVWHTDEASLHMTNGVVVDDILFGLSHLNSGQYFGLDLDTGELLWTSNPRQAENAAIVRAGNAIFSLEADAELVVLEHNRNRFNPVKRYEVAESETWTQPTLSGNRLFIKDISSLTLWTID